MPNKTDRHDAAGLAQIVRTGWFKEVRIKSHGAYVVRALLRRATRWSASAVKIENEIRGLLKTFGVMFGKKVGGFTRRAEEIVAGELAARTRARPIVEALVAARRAILERIKVLDSRIRAAAASNSAMARLFMTAPGVGADHALSVASAYDDASRFRRSSSAGAYLGLTPRRYKSGEISRNGRISKRGDRMTRTCLYEAANVLLTRNIGGSCLRNWALGIAKRAGPRRRRSRWRASWPSCSTRCGGPGSRSKSGAPHDVHQHLGGVRLITRTLDEMRPAGTHGRMRSLPRLRPLRDRAHHFDPSDPKRQHAAPLRRPRREPWARRTDRGGPSP